MKRKINIEKVKKLLKKSGKTQKEFASLVNMSEPVVSASFNGSRALPFDYVFEIASFFKVEPLSITIKNDTKNQQGQPVQKAS